LNMDLASIDKLLNKESGLKGLCGINDMREVIDKSNEGDQQARIALEVYAYRIKKYIGAYYAVLGRLDALIFTAGIGEHSAVIRELSCSEMQNLGIEIDKEKDKKDDGTLREINTEGSKIKILVIPTNEELKIAQRTKQILE